jgi:uncharacterized SAM-binding protein YcdF (DUF218 family)
MYFIFSKLLLYLLFPLSWVFILFIISFIINNKKRKRRCLIASVVILYVFSNSFLFNSFARCWDVPAYQLKNGESYSCAIVLGGFSGDDFNGNGHFTFAADRFIQGVKLFEMGKVSHVLISSGNGNLFPGGFKEADWVKTQLNDMRLPDSTVLIEDRSRNTIENARFSNAMLKKSHLAGPYLLVTSAFHMRRAAMIFKKEGVNFTPFSCNFIRSGKLSFDDFFIPDAEKLSNWNIYIKEVVGYVVNSING